MSAALDWIAAYLAEGRTVASIRAPERVRAEIEAAGYAVAGEDADFPDRLILVDTDGREWAAVVAA